ncbi:MAG: putative toxin-antitoxin system toxin component, PIN family [Pirellulaceae bacterium]|nr:putative toxin-antitoxin system toxin component, PIN family [Pirellulaceae bacterium]
MQRVVFDCMIFLQAAARSTGPAAVLLELVENGMLQLVVSVEILDEIGDVLRRPELTTKFKSLTPQVVTEFLNRLQICSETVDSVPKVFV